MVETATPTFTDIAGHWAEQDILWLASLGIVGGFPDNTFRPNLGVEGFTRAQVVSFLAKLLRALPTVLLVKHTMQSQIPDDTDTSLVRPSDWNAEHPVILR